MAKSQKASGSASGSRGGKGKTAGARVAKGVKGTFSVFGKVLATIFLIFVIAGCICVTMVSVYVMQFMKSDVGIDLRSLELSATTIVYANDPETGAPYELRRLHDVENRIWVPIEDIPEHVQNVTIAGEDKRFYDHLGVDWRRTIYSFANEFLHMGERQGGSTITQQVIKNITDDDGVTYERKIREIFRALNLEKKYTKDDILEAYLNTVNFGHGTYGIQAAANLYFGKDVKDLTVPEVASIIATTKNPAHLDPINNVEDNRERRNYIIDEYCKMGEITEEEARAYKAEPIVTQRSQMQDEEIEEKDIQSYFEDAMIEEIIADLMETYSYTRSWASHLIYNSGYRIYSTVDESVQDVLESYYTDISRMPPVNNAVYPQGACVVTDPYGKVLGLVGGTGVKEGARLLNHATQTPQQPGSSIKPLTVYGQGIENNVVTWSTLIDDNPVDVRENGTPWPVNFNGIYQGPMPVVRAIQLSTNTVAVRLAEKLGPANLVNFLKDSFAPQFLVSSGPYSDADRAPMALGAMSQGFTPLELTGMFQIFGNGGTYVRPYTYTRVLDSEGNVVLEKNITPKQVISPETAAVMNRLLQSVVNEGTARAVKFSAQPVAGKTGTTSDDLDHWFVGYTPYYVCGIWLGYDEIQSISYLPNTYPPLPLFRNIMTDLHKDLPIKEFEDKGEVVQLTYCLESGNIASIGCEKTAVGYYKSSYTPNTCTSHLDGGFGIPENGDEQEEDGRKEVNDGEKVRIPIQSAPEETKETATQAPIVVRRPEED